MESQITCTNCHSYNVQKKIVLCVKAVYCKDCKTLHLSDEFANLKMVKA
jgi:late competence protein required for DNA uptake (superfamily II DNA/RNA helicase)